MGVRRTFSWWTVLLLSLGPLRAAGDDLRLVEAVKQGDQEAVRSLLQQGADVNAREADGATALAWATHRADSKTVELLLSAGADPSAASDYGVTPLSLACTNRDGVLVDRLLRAGAEPNAAKWTGETPLMTCAGTGTTEGIRALLAHGADVNGRENEQGQTALMWAMAGGHPGVGRRLIEKGANVNTRSTSGFPPLLFAARSGDVESARILLAAGANVNDTTPEHGSALVVASASGHEALALFLLEKGANPNLGDANGATPLHYAVRNGLLALTGILFDPNYRVSPPSQSDLAKALLAHGANPDARIQKGITHGPYGGAVSMVGATPLFLAAVAVDVEVLRILAAGGADTRIGNRDNTTPLMVAAGVICAGAGCDFNRRDEEEQSQAVEAVKLIVELGADIDGVNNNGRTAMHSAAFTGADAIVQYLADHGAQVDIADRNGETPWSMAAGISPVLRFRGLYGNHESTANLLLELGATPRGQEDIGTPNSATRPGTAPAYPEPTAPPK